MLKSFLKDGEATMYEGVTVNFIPGRTAVMTIFDDGEAVDRVIMHNLITKEAMHAMMKEKGFELKPEFQQTEQQQQQQQQQQEGAVEATRGTTDTEPERRREVSKKVRREVKAEKMQTTTTDLDVTPDLPYTSLYSMYGFMVGGIMLVIGAFHVKKGKGKRVVKLGRISL